MFLDYRTIYFHSVFYLLSHPTISFNYFSGLFDVHEKSVNPFLCGKVNTLHGFQLLEAFHYALGLVNNKQGIFADKLQGVQVGGIGLDGCQSDIRSGFLVSNIHNGMVSLVKNGKTIDPKEIDAYIGTYSSDSSIYVNRILNDLNIPQVSYASSSTQLKDQLRYPYFYRTVPADDNQAEAMVDFLDKHNIRYVQVLYTDTSYGILGSKAFEEAASRKRICVAQMVSYPDEGIVSNEISNDVVTALLQKPVANTVVVFAGTNYINALLKAVGRVAGDTSPFKFIGSETWGNSEDAIIGSEKYASGSVSLGLETVNLKVFDEYLGKKTPLNSQGNPWFSEYYEEIWDCYLSVPSVNRQKECAQTARSIPLSTQYRQDPGVLHVINAVFSSALALDKALTEVCGEGYTTVCEAYKNRNDRRDVLLKKLDSVEFEDLSKTNFKFENREGNKGYDFYSITIQSVTSGYIYKKVRM
ncbi:hypothetical protein LOTGIDRAFT_103681 [Lottia gigantea]|uniref:Receptor ligand binding region domain-containing protein n=1 Tax=Lottia gigantea TaxID=225164 RepID=V4A214_LOTGI|nr:hypothetical protein LOTGIDRAFT_103681 [Lottia gigantea]ESO97858.1 hypothetical protein LOTGIDRAFT_103681 [Lottia gigantea]